jgi:hypothetical protein
MQIANHTLDRTDFSIFSAYFYLLEDLNHTTATATAPHQLARTKTLYNELRRMRSTLSPLTFLQRFEIVVDDQSRRKVINRTLEDLPKELM